MNSTDLDSLITAVFDDTVLRLHEQMKMRGLVLFESDGGASLDSYYYRRAQTRMSREDFDSAGYEDAAGFAAALERIWKGETRVDLVSHLKAHVHLAKSLAAVENREEEEVSPFLYAMF